MQVYLNNKHDGTTLVGTELLILQSPAVQLTSFLPENPLAGMVVGIRFGDRVRFYSLHYGANTYEGAIQVGTSLYYWLPTVVESMFAANGEFAFQSADYGTLRIDLSLTPAESLINVQVPTYSGKLVLIGPDNGPFADETAARAGGLTDYDVYFTAAGALNVVTP